MSRISSILLGSVVAISTYLIFVRVYIPISIYIGRLICPSDPDPAGDVFLGSLAIAGSLLSVWFLLFISSKIGDDFKLRAGNAKTQVLQLYHEHKKSIE